VPDRDVLVVGSGLAGLSAAAMLQESGFDVEVVERAESLQAAGAGLTLHPNARAALGSLDAVLTPHGAELRRQVVEDHDGVRSELAWDAVWSDGRVPLAIARSVLAEQLYAQLEPGTVTFSSHPVALTQRADAVDVELSDGRVARCRVAIGADGIRSWVRRQVVDPDAEPRYLGQVYWRTVAPATGPMAFADWHVWRSGRHYAGGLPVGHGRAHFFLQMAAPEVPAAATSAESRGRFERVAAGFPARLREIAESIRDEPLHFTAASTLAAARYVAGRVGLVGDAAHALTPASTQGGAMAVEDARVLTEELLAHGPGPEALARYAARRRPRVAHVLRMSRLHLMLLESEMPAGARQDGATARGPVAWYRQMYGPLAAAA
jgi:2-polyprenyl-6-methoxyphenol hydroxylase-like FAD-dependent oxidoreductase